MTSAYNLGGMPKLTPGERVTRAKDALAAAVAAIESDRERGRHDEAWKAATELASVLDDARTANAQARGRIVTDLLDRRFRLAEIAARFGVSVSWVGKISAASRKAEGHRDAAGGFE